MIGNEDLGANGNWQVVAEYGPVWIPRVRADWVPYRFGHWAWVDSWGLTWIDDAPWGFVAFHYGRWALLPARGWGWVPGTVVPAARGSWRNFLPWGGPAQGPCRPMPSRRVSMSPVSPSGLYAWRTRPEFQHAR